MASAEFSSLRPTTQEWRQFISAAIQTASALATPYAPLIYCGAEFLYNHRDSIRRLFGASSYAYSFEGSTLPLSTPTERVAPQQGTLSLNITLTPSARDLGLRNGDPVIIILIDHTFAPGRSGLVVPTQVGERVDLAVLRSSYSLAAFGSRTESLFAMPDPYTAVAGNGVLLGGRHQLELPLMARGPVQTPQHAVVPNITGTVVGNNFLFDRRRQLGPPSTVGRSFLTLPSRAFPCDQCSMTFSTQADLDGHKRLLGLKRS